MLRADTAPHAVNGSRDAPLPDARLPGSLHDHLAGLCGYRGCTALAEFARRPDQEQPAAIGAFRSPSRGLCTTPVATSFLNMLQHVPPDCLDAVFRDRAGTRSDGSPAPALDGRTIRGASRHRPGGPAGPGCRRQQRIPALRGLARTIGARGRILTADAMHVRHETAAALVDAGGDYVLTAVKGNRKGMHEQLRLSGGRGSGRMHAEEAGRQHGRTPQRHCMVVDVPGPEWNGFCPLDGRRQAFRIIRCREVVRTGKRGMETVHGLTSLGPEAAGARRIADHVRSHRHIETRLHHVRDFTRDEDRCRARVGNVPENLAAISSMAISPIRLDGRFEHVPPADRHFAARPPEAPDAVMS